MWHIYKEDHSDLNFALGCLYCDAISLLELKKWLEYVIISESCDNLPSYIYDLLDFDEPLFHISKVIGFNTINNLSAEDEYSLYGIAYIRGIDIYQPPIDKNRAIDLLKKK